MATREEIKVGLKDIKLSEWSYDGKTNHPHFLSPNDADQILNYLHSQGVAIMVERELPPKANITIVEGNQSVVIPIKILSDAGYVAVKPLGVMNERC